MSGPPSRGREPVGADVALALVALTAGLGAGRLTTGPASARVVVPVAACVLAGHLVVSLASRLAPSGASLRDPGQWRPDPSRPDPSRPDPSRPGWARAVRASGCAALGAVAVVLVACWTLLWPATRWGVPDITTWRSAMSWLQEAGAVITAGPTPLAPTTGVVLCLALGAGLVAVMGRCLLAWSWRSGRVPPLVAVLPATGLFAYAALLSSDRARVGATLAFALAVVLFAPAARPSIAAEPPGRPRPGARRRRAHRPPAGLLASSAMLAVTAAVVLGMGPALGSMRVDAFPHPVAGVGAGGGGGSPGTVALLDSLAAPSGASDTTLMFRARSPVPTYWQVAVLTQYDGVEWTAQESTLSSRLPEPTAGTFVASVQVEGLRSTLLPAPPGATAVAGEDAGSLRVTAGGSVEATAFSGAGTRYAVRARVPPAPDAGGGSAAALYTGVAPSALGPYLALPALSPAVVALAHRIVAGSTGPLAESDALVRFFDSGRFRYTLQPPVSGGADPLAAFLFDTRAGFCQQFAGAFAVLARAVGLPTRVAVGFSTGEAHGTTYDVLGADAHSWPEVYLGPGVGWVSFEPTPGGNGTPPSVRLGTEAAGTGADRTQPRGTDVTTPPGLGAGLANLVPGGAAARRVHQGTGGPSGAPTILLGAAAATAATVAAVLLVARRRRARRRALRRWASHWAARGRQRRRARRPTVPADDVLTSFRHTEAALARVSLGRRPGETPAEHAARVDAAMAARGHRRGPPSGRTPAPALGPRLDVGDYRTLAALATTAAYGPHRCTAEDAARARALEAGLRAELSGERT